MTKIESETLKTRVSEENSFTPQTPSIKRRGSEQSAHSEETWKRYVVTFLISQLSNSLLSKCEY